VPLPSAADSDASDTEVSDEDLEFVKQHGKHLGFLTNLDRRALDK
jgi:nucleolar complex protein 3